MRIKTQFHINGFALSLALKQRLDATRNMAYCFHSYQLFTLLFLESMLEY